MRGELKSGPKLVDKNSINLGPNRTGRPGKLTTSIIEVLKIKSSTTVPEVRDFISSDRGTIVLITLRQYGIEVPKHNPRSLRSPLLQILP